jgi:hypothetical protein
MELIDGKPSKPGFREARSTSNTCAVSASRSPMRWTRHTNAQVVGRITCSGVHLLRYGEPFICR